ncbi:MAG: efflux RND transporter periplasmic adaptor subunit [Pseudomonadota bacterium]
MIRKLIVVGGNIGIIVAIVVLLQIIQATAPRTERQPVEPKLPAAFVEAVSYEPVSLSVSAQGEVRPLREIALTPEVGGKIAFVSEKFVDGGIIEKGDLLVRLEDADYRLAVTRAQARVANARQALQVEQAESELARQDYEELSGNTSDNASALTLREPQLARATAEYESAQADLSGAQLALRRTEIRAPFNGRVRSISANFGQFVGVGSPIGVLFSTDIAEVRLPLSDSDLAKLQLPLAFSSDYGSGPNVTFTTSAAGATRTWEGHLVRVAAAIDATTRQISAIAQVQDPYGEGSDNGFPMAIGLFVNASIEGPTLDRAVVLPRIAVNDERYVYTLNDENIVERTPVDVVATTSAGVIVTGGLENGDRVVVSRLNAAVGTEVLPLDPSNPDALRDAQEEADTEADDADANTTTQANSGPDAGQGVQ